jgi:hypothetical protein
MNDDRRRTKERKKKVQRGFGISKAMDLLGMSYSTLLWHINQVKEGKAELPIPYKQHRPGGDYKFDPEDLRIWEWDVTHGIKPCTKAKNRIRIVGLENV